MAIELRGSAPLFEVFDMPAAFAFYRGVLGFEVVNTNTQNRQYDSANARSASGLSVAVRRHNYSPSDIDIRAHLGQCLLRLKRPAEARPLLEGVCAENPKHDYGYSLMALAETLAALGEIDWLDIGEEGYHQAVTELHERYFSEFDLEPTED